MRDLLNAKRGALVAGITASVAWIAMWSHWLVAQNSGLPLRLSTVSRIQFNRDIAPLLIEHCLDCHSGPQPKGGLDLSRAKTARAGGDNGPALVPGKLDDSLIWRRVRAGEMPLKHPLPDADKELLRRWIKDGAQWGQDPLDPFRFTTRKRAGLDWWALQPLSRPPPPVVKNASWARHPIDRFVLARLEARGLAPSRDADRRTLIRRLSFDLVGLPPSPEEVEEFRTDDRPDAYERLVERLLASPHYGERWARHWLDVVRFGESDGFERNGPRLNAWHYRDWVVKALNADIPYDEFCRLQIAGDVLRPGDVEALKATGFLVAGIHNTVLPMLKSARDTAFQDELEDLVGSVGPTFLGLTVHCGRCHDHKFDPVSQKDYYRLAAALSGVRHGEREIISESVKRELARLVQESRIVQARLETLEGPARKAILAERGQKFEPGRAPPMPVAAWDFRADGKDQIGNLSVTLFGGARFTSAGLIVDGKSAFAKSDPLPIALREKTLEAWVKLDNLAQQGGGVMTVQTPDGAVFDAIVFGEQQAKHWLAGSDFFRRTSPLQGPEETTAAAQPVHFALAYHADGKIAAYRNGRPYGKPYQSSGLVRFEAKKTVVAFGVRHGEPGGNRMLAGTIVQARLYDRALAATEIATSAKATTLVTEAEIWARLSVNERQQRDRLRARLADLGRATKRQQELFEQTKIKMYVALSEQPAPTRLLVRGQITEPADVVAPAGIAVFANHRANFGLPANAPESERRAKLAEWLTSPVNPLFARVMVNRLWHYHFGIGIVDTPNDFGFNGGRPSHPEALDWLAAEFAARGYRLKDMHRLIVTSSAYRQASAPRKDGLAADADGRLLWRKQPVRLEAESLRDGMLAVAGLLNREIGGRGFSDYRETSGAGTTYYDPIDPVGPAFHRRSIYRFNPRGHNLGLLDAFDCPDPASAAPRRAATTTPLQALSLWNGAFALRMAASLAARLEAESPNDPDRQLTRAYQLALQRDPLPRERELAQRLIEQHGLRALARALFNSNEFLTIE